MESWLHDFRNQSEDIKALDSPFEWSCLEKAKVPWEASDWVLQCVRGHYQTPLDLAPLIRAMCAQELGPEADTSRLITIPLFTNRLACWCWQLHLAAPDLEPAKVLIRVPRWKPASLLAGGKRAAPIGAATAIAGRASYAV